eukprot:CAMPEP_0198127634 /NCGR_PEP_ID=MMETSP1442-20131203/47635_1 /TAXON_ID= /ORGANISM="Craspedostauros australis, Strain CCMP3328" /LENGTH=36 /DNA_ID= /DNA_START= /DNA_END= /DNA_ORIENTATION=
MTARSEPPASSHHSNSSSSSALRVAQQRERVPFVVV